MKKIKRVIVVEGDPSEIKKEILLKRNNTTNKIDLLKRDSSGVLRSIVENGDVLANPDKGLTPVASGDEFDQSFETLLNLATTEGAEVELDEALQVAIGTVADYLPRINESVVKGTNKINVSGYVDTTKVIISTGGTMLKIAFTSDSKVTLTKVEL